MFESPSVEGFEVLTLWESRGFEFEGPGVSGFEGPTVKGLRVCEGPFLRRGFSLVLRWL